MRIVFKVYSWRWTQGHQWLYVCDVDHNSFYGHRERCYLKRHFVVSHSRCSLNSINETIPWNHLEKYETKLCLKNFKRIRKLARTGDLYFSFSELFGSHYQLIRLKSRFSNFCKSFIPDFGNLHYLLHLNESDLKMIIQMQCVT